MMKIIEKFNKKNVNLKGESPVCIAFLGDSVTQGCFGDFQISETLVDTVFDAENGYHTKLRKILNMLYPRVPLNIINAGISGGNAKEGAERLDRDVLRFSPDLCVVCFGLNDSCLKIENSLEVYKNSLTEIFKRLKENDIEVIFMTPNMMCTEITHSTTEPLINQFTVNVSKVQLSGKLEEFLNEAKKIAKSFDIPVCDCYAKWKTLYDSGVNTNILLSNKINHPTKEMNWMFAYSLAETIFNN